MSAGVKRGQQAIDGLCRRPGSLGEVGRRRERLTVGGAHWHAEANPVDAACNFKYIYFSLSFPVARKMKKHEKLKKRKLQDPKMTLDGIVLPADDL